MVPVLLPISQQQPQHEPMLLQLPPEWREPYQVRLCSFPWACPLPFHPVFSIIPFLYPLPPIRVLEGLHMHFLRCIWCCYCAWMHRQDRVLCALFFCIHMEEAGKKLVHHLFWEDVFQASREVLETFIFLLVLIKYVKATPFWWNIINSTIRSRLFLALLLLYIPHSFALQDTFCSLLMNTVFGVLLASPFIYMTQIGTFFMQMNCFLNTSSFNS